MSSGRSTGVPNVIAGLFRGLLLAAATAGAVFGLLVVFHPFDAAGTNDGPFGSPAATALQQQIEAARIVLAATEAALDNVKAETPGATPSAESGNAQYGAQIAAATERRDLALQHAAAIREALKSGLPVASLADIRDSVVIGQLMSQQAALDAQIAEQGARFKANHPVMRALNAQHTALAAQIGDKATSIALALEAEAKLDDAQIKLLQTRLDGLAVVGGATSTADPAAMQARAVAERTELDRLMDAYFRLQPVEAAQQPATASLNPLNFVVIAVAAIAAILFQIVLAAGRRTPPAPARDLSAWAEDREARTEPVATPQPAPALRHAS